MCSFSSHNISGKTVLDRSSPGPGVIFSDFSGVIPDLVYVSSERGKEIATGDRITGAPELIIEVLSPGPENRRRDEHAKRQLYKKYGVKEYWIVDPQRLRVQIFRTARLKLIAKLGVRDGLSTPLLPGFRLLGQRDLRVG